MLHEIPSSALETPDGQPGLRAEYFANGELQGVPARTETDTAVAFTWLDHPPLGGGIVDSFSVRWSGRIVAPVTGTYRIGFVGMSAAKFYFRDSLMFAFQTRYEPEQHAFDVPLTAGHAYDVRVEFRNWGPNPDAHLVWAPPGTDRLRDALAEARRADAVVLVLGLSPRLEGEESGLHIPGFDGGDRTTLALPAPQEQLLEAVGALGKPTVVVLTTGSAVAVPWAAAHANAMLEAWYPGEAGGEAIADVLFGDYNPAGRLPVTFYQSVRDLPPFSDYAMDGRTYRYFTGTPLYPFGFGLSYTTFKYSDLDLPSVVTPGSAVRLAVNVENTGARAGDEVVQVYAAHPGAPYRVPLRALVAFRRVHLGAGERRSVAFTLGAEALAVVDTAGRRVVPPGPVVLSVGGEQPGMTGALAASTTETLTDTIRMKR
jgi:beta-glucosidase